MTLTLVEEPGNVMYRTTVTLELLKTLCHWFSCLCCAMVRVIHEEYT